MSKLVLPLWVCSLILMTACSHNKMENHYSCSYEATAEAYENCMAVSRGVDEDTTQAAGRQVPDQHTTPAKE